MMPKNCAYSVLAVAAMIMISCGPRKPENRRSYDLIISDGRIIDGTGNPWFRGDIGIQGDRIAAIGNLGTAEALRRIDANDRAVAPGFIDMMGTSDTEVLVDPRCASKITQGITLMVSGEGYSAGPVNERMISENKSLFDRFGLRTDWRTLGQFLDRLEATPKSINFATFVGSGGLRDYVIGTANRPAAKDELAEMEGLASQAMEEGAFGLSSALMYVPDRFNSTEELIAMAKAAARHRGVYITHQRSEANAIGPSLDEVFRIAGEAGIRTQIYHLKTMYIQNWGKMPEVVQRISGAREQGLDITACVYPYVAAAAGLVDLLPLGARRGFRQGAGASTRPGGPRADQARARR